MDILEIPGETRNIGGSQGYLGLSIRDTTIHCSVNGPNTPCMESHWKPTTEELDHLLNGGVVQLRVLGIVHPPVLLEVVDGE